jgi:hypothetical protein
VTASICVWGVRYYGREIAVCGDEVTCLYLSCLRVLIVTWPYESIVPKIAADVCCDDLTINAIFGYEVLVRTGRGQCASVPFCVSS